MCHIFKSDYEIDRVNKPSLAKSVPKTCKVHFSSHFEKLNWHFLLFKVDVVKQLLSNIQNGIDVVHPVRVNLVGHVDQRHLKTGKIEVLHPHRNSFNRS